MARKKKKPPQRRSIAGTRPPYNVAPTVASDNKTSESQIHSPPSGQEHLALQALMEHGKANYHGDSIREQERDSRDRARLCVEKITAAVGALGLIGLLVTLWMTREANTLAREANEQTRDLVYAGDRSWVGIVAITMKTFEVGKNISIEIRIENSGRTPALKVRPRMWGRFVIGVPGGPPTDSFDILYQSETVLTPGQSSGVPLVHTKVLDAEELDKVTRGEITFMIWGGVTYTDRFKIQGETTLCAYYNHISKDFVACTKGNDAK